MSRGKVASGGRNRKNNSVSHYFPPQRARYLLLPLSLPRRLSLCIISSACPQFQSSLREWNDNWIHQSRRSCLPRGRALSLKAQHGIRLDQALSCRWGSGDSKPMQRAPAFSFIRALRWGHQSWPWIKWCFVLICQPSISSPRGNVLGGEALCWAGRNTVHIALKSNFGVECYVLIPVFSLLW